jgi:hypothetical protein
VEPEVALADVERVDVKTKHATGEEQDIQVVDSDVAPNQPLYQSHKLPRLLTKGPGRS